MAGTTILVFSILQKPRKIKQNRAENAKPSQFSRVFSEVSDGLLRDNAVQQALIKRCEYAENPVTTQFTGFFVA